MQNKHSTRHEIWLALIFIIASGMISFLHGLGTGWDFLDYHFYNGYAFIHHRLGFDLAPAGNWTYYNPLLDSLNYLMIRYLPAMLTTFLMGASCGLLGFFLYKIADLLFQGSGLKCRAFTIVSCIIGLTAPTIIPGIGSVMNDLQSLTPFIIALWMTLKALSEKQSRLFIFAAGLLNGLAPALKLTNIDYSFSLVLISFLFALTDKQQLRTAWLLSLGSFLAFILGEAWWMAILYQHFANPFFPYFNHFFHSPYFPDENLKADPRWGAHSLWGAIQLIFV
ncbi:MAG: hypothetical protein K0S29_596, partial [Gammaproteobacteria bacterium]|nr:hypothetical protein [Gammaproteobacteria bacterium]